MNNGTKNTEPTRAELTWDAMKDEEWHTLKELAEATNYDEASVSAQIREFRGPKFGMEVDTKYAGLDHRQRKIYTYRLKIASANPN